MAKLTIQIPPATMIVILDLKFYGESNVHKYISVTDGNNIGADAVHTGVGSQINGYDMDRMIDEPNRSIEQIMQITVRTTNTIELAAISTENRVLFPDVLAEFARMYSIIDTGKTEA